MKKEIDIFTQLCRDNDLIIIPDRKVKKFEDQSELFDTISSLLAIFKNGSKCHDCADNNGTCPYSNLPCDPYEALIIQVKTLKSNEQRYKEALERIAKETIQRSVLRIAEESLKNK